MSFSSETVREFSEKIDYSGNYENCTLLFESAQSRIFRASKCGRYFLLKAPKSDAGVHLAMLKREYELSIGCSHPFLIHTFTYEPESPIGPCIAMEYVDGRNLREFLRDQPSLRQRKRVFQQILSAIKYLHQNGIIHNDLKPENILITHSDNDVRVIDFGLSDDDAHYLIKTPGLSPYYSSPELRALARGEQAQIDARSDIFSVGMIMREMFGTLTYRHIASRCLQLHPDKRYSNIDAINKAIARRKRRPFIIAAGILAIAIAAGITFSIQRIHTLQDTITTYEQAERQKEEAVNKLIDEIDEWVNTEGERLISAIERQTDRDSLSKKIVEYVEGYNAIRESTIAKCDDYTAPIIQQYLTKIYNKLYIRYRAKLEEW